MSRYYIGDLHLGHAKLAELRGFDTIGELRGFDTIGEHDEAIMDAMVVATKRDHVYVLGDTCSGSKTGTRHALGLLGKLPSTLHLVSGNHDLAHPMHRRVSGHARVLREFLTVFDSVHPIMSVKLNGRQVMLSHFPYRGNHTVTDRYLEW